MNLMSAGFTINATLYPKLPYDSLRDFAPVTQITPGPAIVVVHPSLPARTVKELIALARAKPGAGQPDARGILEVHPVRDC